MATYMLCLVPKMFSLVQIAANNALAGPNGIGGITVDGSRKEMKITTDKKGNVNLD